MNLLPKDEGEFAKEEYWNRFFKERGSNEFEWYGEYNELIEYLHKYLKEQDSILVVGCGNSMLSSQLYDVGFRYISNIDISSVVIEQMKKKVSKGRPEMVFHQMDALNMTYEKESFTVILDKGTLDALMPNNSEFDKERATKLFAEVDRVLKLNGRYIIISLLQDHILKHLLDYFTKLGWMIRILRCWDVEKKNIAEKGCLTMPVFMVVCIKFRQGNVAQSVLETNIFIDGKFRRVSSKEEIISLIGGIQKTVFNYREAKDEIQICFCKENENQPRYSIYVVDGSKDHRSLLKYAAFIVPLGRETEWMFGSTNGRKYLRETSGFDRLSVITFHRNQSYGTMQDVQDELRLTILQLAPSFMLTTKETLNIPYLTLGDQIGRRETIFSGTSEYSGELLVEDVEIEKEIFRRLIFMSNQGVVQSEVKMKKDTTSKQKRKSLKKVIDSSYVASDHILYMSVAAALKTRICPSVTVAVIGVGGGGLCLLLQNLFQKISITGVDIDSLVVEVAKKYFGLDENERLKVIVGDGLEFLKRKKKCDILMLDVDSKERGSALSCPPPQFLDPLVLQAVVEIIGNEGVFVLNVVSRDSSEHEKLLEKIKEHFKLISWYNLKEDVNRIVFASNWTSKTTDDWRKDLEDAGRGLDKLLKKTLKVRDGLDVDHFTHHLMT